MIINLYRRDHTLWHTPDYPVRWVEYSFGPPDPHQAVTLTSGKLLEKSSAVAIRVSIPPGCSLARGRMISPWDPHHGADATTVAFMAGRGARGLALAAEDPPAIPGESSPEEWAVAFRAASGHRCYAARVEADGWIESTFDPAKVRTWPDPESAAGWLSKVGLSEHEPIPVGSPGWLRPVIERVGPDTCRDFPRAVEFQMREPGRRQQAEEPAPPAPRARADRTGQLLLFAEV